MDNFKILEDLLKPFLSEDAKNKGINIKRVLDIGCGDGYFVKKLRNRGLDAYGIDLKPKTKCKYVRKGDARDLIECFKDMKFDAVIAKGILCTGGQLASWLHKDRKIIEERLNPDQIFERAHPNSLAILRSCYNQLNSPGLFIDYEPHEKHLVRGVLARYKIFYDKKTYTRKDAENIGFKACVFNRDFSVLIKEKGLKGEKNGKVRG